MDQTWVRIYELAGYLGLDPDPYSLRQLTWMAEEKWWRDWGHTSNVMSLAANINRDDRKRRRPFTPWDFLPPDLQAKVQKPREARFTVSDLHSLKGVFGAV